MKTKLRYTLIINNIDYHIDKNRILVGSASNCDIEIKDNTSSVSSYHALILCDKDYNVSVLDLQSDNSTFINGSKILNNTPLTEGDTITFGKVHGEVLTAQQDFEFVNNDVKMYSELQGKKQYVPRPSHHSDILIDDEYCDIIFKDSFTPLSQLPIKDLHISQNDYIENEELEESYELREDVDGKCVQITTTLNGNILEQYYFPLQDGTIFAHPQDKKGTVQLELISQKAPLIQISHKEISLITPEGFSEQSSKMDLEENSVLSCFQGAFQIFVEVTIAPQNYVQLTGLNREKQFIQDTAKKFAMVLLPMLLLLLVNFTPDKKKPLKKLSIIYKKPTKANVDNKKMASTNPNDLNKNTGHKSTKQPDKKIAHSKSGKKAKPKKNLPKKKSKVAKASQKKRKSKTKAKTKAYSFKMASNVSSVFSNSKTVSVVKNSASSQVKTNSSATESLATKVSGTSSNSIGNMGSDSNGRSTASFGSKGLSSKSGRDTAYIQTETVVLGSMDPELLRKILQQYLPQFRHCYQQELAYNSEDIKGIVDLNFEITGSGKVAKINIRAKDSRFSKRGTNCMAKVLAIIDFPKPKGGGRVAVRQPLSFFSEQEKS